MQFKDVEKIPDVRTKLAKDFQYQKRLLLS
jgi:hypothetical protein